MKKNKKLPPLDSSQKQYRRDGEGRIIVDMNIKDDTDFLSVFSTNDTPVISSEVAEFLENSTHWIMPDEQLTLHIKSTCVNETKQQLYNDAIKEYYTEKFYANERELKIQNLIALLLAILGIIVLASSIFLQYRFDSVIWAEVIDIVAWVLIWESVDIKFFKTRELVFKRKRYGTFISMKILYKNQ